MRAECSNCKYFMTEVMMGNGRAMDDIGSCVRLRKSFVDADDCCNSYTIAQWARDEQKNGGEE